MDTIKAIVIKKLRQRKSNNAEDIADYMVSEEIRMCLDDVCALLPDETPAGREFAEIMSRFMVGVDPDANPKMEMLVGETTKALIRNTINALYDKIMGEPANLDEDYCADYKQLRQKLIEAINNRR